MTLRQGEKLARQVTKLLDQEENATIEKVNDILLEAFNQLEKRFTKAYREVQQRGGSLFERERSAVIIDKISDVLDLLGGKRGSRVQSILESLLKTARQQGFDSAKEMMATVTTEQPSTSTPSINLDAIKFQAKEGYRRLKNHTEEFRNRVSTLIGANLAMGSSPRKAAQQLRKEFGITRRKAETVARTESMSSLNEATNAFYAENEVKYVMRVETEDRRICGYCQARAGRIYRLQDKPGLAHPNCRVYYMPIKPEWHTRRDLEWATQHRSEIEARNPEQKPNYGDTPFERATGTKLKTVTVDEFLNG